MENEGKRLNKYISDAGLCSRREADRLIEEGRVRILRADPDEHSDAKAGARVYEGDTVSVDGKPIRIPQPGFMYIMLNKPKGVVCTSDERTENNVIRFLNVGRYITYVGRLDKDSTGLLLLTNDGTLNNRIMKAANHHEKEYVCTTDKAVTQEFMDAMQRGVMIALNENEPQHKVKTRPCKVKRLGEKKFAIVLTQGMNRQIRRMGEALGFKITSINRIRIMNLKLKDLPVGAHRNLTPEEVEQLKKAIDGVQHDH